MNAVISKIVRLNERDNLLTFLDQMSEIVYKLNFDMKNFIKEKGPFHVSAELTEYFGDLLSGDREALHLRLVDLKNEIKKMPVIKITLAFKPREEFIAALTKKVREESGKNIVFDLVIDETVLAGAIVEGESRVRSYLLKDYFERGVKF